MTKKMTTNQILDEANGILFDISQKLLIKKNGQLPKISTKKGGSSAVYYSDDHEIVLRENVWYNHSLGGKRLLLVHECIHACGVNHSGKHFYSNHGGDILTLLIYTHIWGYDENLASVFNQMVDFTSLITKDKFELLTAKFLLIGSENISD